MKFTLSWLKDHLETEASLEEITETLTDLGLEVEGVENPAASLAAFTIGKVLRAEQHPDADKLKVCQVLTGAGESQIICGAPNARDGITVVVAQPGDYVPGIDTTIGVGKIRGVESHGMMCSEREMGLGDAHDGIIELPSGEVGERFIDWLAANDPGRVDPVIEIAITPNRPDALGVRGVAMDLAARGLGTLKPRDTDPVEGRFACPIGVSIDADTREACPVFFGRMIRGVRNGPSPEIPCAGPLEACEPGTTRKCACSDTRTGAQVCSDDGSCFGPCDCTGFEPSPPREDVSDQCDRLKLTIRVPEKLSKKPYQLVAFFYHPDKFPPKGPPCGGTDENQVEYPEIDVDKPYVMTVKGCTYYRENCLSGPYHLYVSLMMNKTLMPIPKTGDFIWGLDQEPIMLGSGKMLQLEKEITLVPIE